MSDSGVRKWLEDQLRKMLGFDEVEEIAKFALESFSVSQSVELRQYLEQFLGQSKEVEKLCDELSARRAGGASKPLKSKLSTVSAAETDFWGGGTSSRTAKASSGAPRGQLSATGQGKGKAKGKLYQKATAEDFWGGGTTSGSSGRSTAAKSANAANPVLTPASTLQPAVTASPARLAAASAVAAESAPVFTKAGSKVSGKPSGSQSKVSFAANASAALTGTKAATATKAKNGKGLRVASKSVASAPALPPVVDTTPQWSGVTCQCMATKHDLVTNCTSCGKIACVVEGGFGCSFCGSTLPVTGREPRKVGGSSGSQGANSSGANKQGHQSAALKEALAQKEKLLLFDRTSASRTRVLDDQGDYFTSHNWLSQKEREKGEAEEKARRDDAALQRGARRQVKLSIDIMGRRVVETQSGANAADGAQEAGAGPGGISVELGSTASRRSVEDGAVNTAELDPVANTKQLPSGQESGGSGRPSLENTGLRGRAKEVYDVMRANLEKQGRRRPMGKGGAVAETSRVSLWRVQHDVAPDDDVLRESPTSGEIGQCQPRDELPCR